LRMRTQRVTLNSKEFIVCILKPTKIASFCCFWFMCTNFANHVISLLHHHLMLTLSPTPHWHQPKKSKRLRSSLYPSTPSPWRKSCFHHWLFLNQLIHCHDGSKVILWYCIDNCSATYSAFKLVSECRMG